MKYYKNNLFIQARNNINGSSDNHIRLVDILDFFARLMESLFIRSVLDCRC